ncbi:MAG: hypothetical protein EBU97_04500 [Rhodobacteraceae bacterium]|nr:hypothetical protein [Paracoccaceae bacterium]
MNAFNPLFGSRRSRQGGRAPWMGRQQPNLVNYSALSPPQQSNTDTLGQYLQSTLGASNSVYGQNAAPSAGAYKQTGAGSPLDQLTQGYNTLQNARAQNEYGQAPQWTDSTTKRSQKISNRPRIMS